MHIWVGYDKREAEAFSVACSSARLHLNLPVPIHGLVLEDLIQRGLYTRKTELRPTAADKPQMWDVISDAPMSTEFAISRFLVPYLSNFAGWSLFMDCDMLIRGNVMRMFEEVDHTKAVYCVKHAYEPQNEVKMDGQVQTRYARKNWSSVMLFNNAHPANKRLMPDYVNSLPGRNLHRFCWLIDEEIGELDPKWNHLVGHSTCPDPKIVHFTEGGPWMDGYEDVPFADEWRAARNRWACRWAA